MKINASDLLLVIDVQNDFCPNGALAVENGDEIVDGINQLMSRFEHRVLTQDWHPAGHKSFASSHEGMSPFSTIEMPYGSQTLWPDHCIQGTKGAEFHPSLNSDKAQAIIRKGTRIEIDSYSAFLENDHKTPTGLHGLIQNLDIKRVFMVGLATDFCVAFSAIDAAALGIETYVVEDLCRSIDLDGSLAVSYADLKAANVKRIVLEGLF